MKALKVSALQTTLLVALSLLLPLQVFAQEDWFEKGLMLSRAQQYDKAIEAFSTAIELISGDFEAYNYRGVARTHKGDYGGAIADYTRALQIKPEYAEALNNRGYAWVRKSNLSQALNDFSRAIEINPVLMDAYNSKAWILATSSQAGYRSGKEAVVLAQKAVDIHPGIDSLDTLAAAFAANGQFDEAVSTQKRVIPMLLQQESFDRLSFYLEHLYTYKAGQPLRINYDSSSPRVKLEKFNESPATGTGRHMPPPAAHPSTGVVVEPYPFTIQISAYRDPAKSVSVATTLANKGDPAFACPVHIPGKGDWHRVFIGSYRSRAEAQSAAVELKKRKFQYVQVTRKPYTVEVGLFDSIQAAGEIITRLRTKGYITYSLPDRNRPGKTRILIGAYETRNEAHRLSEQLAKDSFTSRVLPR